jgi:hypothetical protein
MFAASLRLGHIFVTNEVHITTEHRFENLGSNDTFGQLEMQRNDPGYLEHRTFSRLEWVDKDGVKQHSQTWARD